jgi:hypothetical protein
VRCEEAGFQNLMKFGGYQVGPNMQLRPVFTEFIEKIQSKICIQQGLNFGCSDLMEGNT